MPNQGAPNNVPRLLGPVLAKPAKPALAGVVASLPLVASLLFWSGFATNTDDGGLTPPQQASDFMGNEVLVPIVVEHSDRFEQALDNLALSDFEKERVRTAVANNELQLGLLTLWDWADVDGDTVVVLSAGFEQTVEVHHEPTVITIPYRGAGVVQVRGLRDGGGGITLGMSVKGGSTILRLSPINGSVEVTIP